MEKAVKESRAALLLQGAATTEAAGAPDTKKRSSSFAEAEAGAWGIVDRVAALGAPGKHLLDFLATRDLSVVQQVRTCTYTVVGWLVRLWSIRQIERARGSQRV